MSQELSQQLDATGMAWVRLLSAHAELTRSFNAELQSAHGLTVTDFEVLRHLDVEPEGRMRRVDLAQGVGLTPSGITRLLDGLQEAGLVVKSSCETDGRVSYALITPAGRQLVRTASQTHLAAIGALFRERFSAEEIDALVELLGRLPGAQKGVEACPGMPD